MTKTKDIAFPVVQNFPVSAETRSLLLAEHSVRGTNGK